MGNEQGGGGSNGAPAPGPGVSIDSDVLAFFYTDAARALARLRQDAGDLERYAGRIGRFVGEAGIDAAADVRREFHRACDLANRTSALTYRLLAILRD